MGRKFLKFLECGKISLFLPSHLKDKLVECKILGLKIIFLKHVKILFLYPMIFIIIFEKSGCILLPGCDLWSLWKFVGFAFCPVS